MMLSPLSQPVVRPLYNGGSVVLRGAHHHLLSMLVDTLTLNSTNANFCPYSLIHLHLDIPIKNFAKTKRFANMFRAIYMFSFVESIIMPSDLAKKRGFLQMCSVPPPP